VVRAAVISDIHLDLSGRTPMGGREFDLGDLMVERLVHRLNRYIKPDITILLGDLVDEGEGPAASEHYRRLKNQVDRIASPTIVIPGNHDGAAFDDVFGPPAEITDCAGVRFVACVDPEEPGYNARRLPEGFDLMNRARREHSGPIVLLQHVPVLPIGSHECPYSYLNVDRIIAQMKASNIGLALSGHYHTGVDRVDHDGMIFHTVAALCERPFCFDVAQIGEGRVEIQHHQLVPAPRPGLVDTHVHTQFSYCGPTMDMGATEALAPKLGLEGLALTEHSGQLYYDESTYWSGNWFPLGNSLSSIPAECRLGSYLDAAREVRDPSILIGFEADCRSDGTLVLDPNERPDIVLGSVHQMDSVTWRLHGSEPMTSAISDEFLGLNESLVRNGVDIVAHPFRILTGVSGVESLYGPMVELLRRNGVAAEINFHLNDPPPEFFATCLARGVRVALGSDAHEHWELGDFVPHIEFLSQLGFTGDLPDITYQGKRCS
jgi:histidinol phosphatase-like PHP family hydrolase/predicted phosphodiesterase